MAASSWPATAYMLHRKDAPALLREPVVLEVAKAIGKKAPQVLIRWALQLGCSVSPKANSHDHLKVRLPLLQPVVLICAGEPDGWPAKHHRAGHA